MTELRGTFVCDFITDFHGKHCVPGELMNSRQEKAEEPENVGNTTGKRQLRGCACTFTSGLCTRSACCTPIPQAAADKQRFQQATMTRSRAILINRDPCKGLSPRPPLGSQHLPRQPSARSVALEGTRVVCTPSLGSPYSQRARALGAGWRYSLTAAEACFSCFPGSDHRDISCFPRGCHRGCRQRREWDQRFQGVMGPGTVSCCTSRGCWGTDGSWPCRVPSKVCSPSLLQLQIKQEHWHI